MVRQVFTVQEHRPVHVGLCACRLQEAGCLQSFYFTELVILRITEDRKLRCCTELKKNRSIKRVDVSYEPKSCRSVEYQLVSSRSFLLLQVATNQCKASGRHFVHVGTWINPTASCCLSYKCCTLCWQLIQVSEILLPFTFPCCQTT